MAHGFFTVSREENGRWNLVAPDGSPFWMAGVNHLHTGPLRLHPNQWQRELENPLAWRDFVVGALRDLGFNALGYDFPTPRPGFPYVWRIESQVNSSAWQDECAFPDIFAPAWEKLCLQNAQHAAQKVGDDPFLVGYFLDDCLEWPVLGRASKRRARNWLESLQNLPPDAPGKRAWLQLLQTRYAHASECAAAYGLAARNWPQIAQFARWHEAAPRDSERVLGDNAAFGSRLAARYYDTLCGAIRRHNANHLILGEPFDGNRGIAPEVLRAATPHLDVLGVQFYGNWQDQIADLTRWHEQSQLPILLADSCFSCSDEAQPRPCGPRCASQTERARAFEHYFESARACPFVVGWNWCGLVDSHQNLEPRRQHTGILRADGAPHPELSATMRRVLMDLPCFEGDFSRLNSHVFARFLFSDSAHAGVFPSRFRDGAAASRANFPGWRMGNRRASSGLRRRKKAA